MPDRVEKEGHVDGEDVVKEDTQEVEDKNTLELTTPKQHTVTQIQHVKQFNTTLQRELYAFRSSFLLCSCL